MEEKLLKWKILKTEFSILVWDFFWFHIVHSALWLDNDVSWNQNRMNFKGSRHLFWKPPLHESFQGSLNPPCGAYARRTHLSMTLSSINLRLQRLSVCLSVQWSIRLLWIKMPLKTAQVRSFEKKNHWLITKHNVLWTLALALAFLVLFFVSSK